jgi:hypothetical protein
MVEDWTTERLLAARGALRSTAPPKKSKKPKKPKKRPLESWILGGFFGRLRLHAVGGPRSRPEEATRRSRVVTVPFFGFFGFFGFFERNGLPLR